MDLCSFNQYPSVEHLGDFYFLLCSFTIICGTAGNSVYLSIECVCVCDGFAWFDSLKWSSCCKDCTILWCLNMGCRFPFQEVCACPPTRLSGCECLSYHSLSILAREPSSLLLKTPLTASGFEWTALTLPAALLPGSWYRDLMAYLHLGALSLLQSMPLDKIFQPELQFSNLGNGGCFLMFPIFHSCTAFSTALPA